MRSNLSRRPRPPMSALQHKIMDYLRQTQSDGVAKITQHQMADAIGSHRGSVIRALGTLEDRGLVSVQAVKATFVTLRQQTG